MWRAAKAQNSSLKTASVESWDWIHYLVEPTIVDYEFRGKENDSACADAISMCTLIINRHSFYGLRNAISVDYYLV